MTKTDKFWEWMNKKKYVNTIFNKFGLKISSGHSIKEDFTKQMLIGYMIEYIMSQKRGGWSHFNPLPLYQTKTIEELYNHLECAVQDTKGD